jgi:hypothetical protein
LSTHGGIAGGSSSTLTPLRIYSHVASNVVQLFQFVRDRNPQVRQIALSNLLGQTPKGSPYRNIFFTGIQAGGLQQSKDKDIIRDLKLLCRDQLVCPDVSGVRDPEFEF